MSDISLCRKNNGILQNFFPKRVEIKSQICYYVNVARGGKLTTKVARLFLCPREGETVANQSIYLEIDVSDLKDKTDALRSVMKPEQFERAMYGIFRRTGGHVKRILRQDLPNEYHVTAKQINAAVKNPKMTTDAGGLGCTIPIRDRRGSIGGRYSAKGYRKGWRALTSGKYKVTAKIVKDGASTLPFNMGSYGGMPPFRNMPSKLGKLTFSRAGKKRGPILKVSGIAIPQMPMNRSQEEVQKDIHDYLANEIERRFMALMKVGR